MSNYTPSVSCRTKVTFCSVIWVCMKAVTRPDKGDVSCAELQSALMLVKYSPPLPPSRQLDSSQSIYTKCSNYSREVLWVRSIMIPWGGWQLAFLLQHLTLYLLVLFSPLLRWNFAHTCRQCWLLYGTKSKDTGKETTQKRTSSSKGVGLILTLVDINVVCRGPWQLRLFLYLWLMSDCEFMSSWAFIYRYGS